MDVQHPGGGPGIRPPARTAVVVLAALGGVAGVTHLVRVGLGATAGAATLAAIGLVAGALGVLAAGPGPLRAALSRLAGVVAVAAGLGALVAAVVAWPEPPGAATALVVVAVGVAIATLPSPGTTRLCAAVSVATATVLVVELLAHLYGAAELSRHWWIGVPLPVALTATSVCAAAALTRPDRPPLSWLVDGRLDGRLLVRLLPVVVLVPVVHRVAMGVAEAAGVSHATGNATAMLASAAAVAIPVVGAARAAARAEAELRTERARLDAVVAALDEGLVVRDRDGHVVLTNPRAQELTRLDFSTDPTLEQIGSEPRFVDGDGQPLPFEEMPTTRTIRTGRAVIGQLLGIRRPDLPDRWLRVSAVPVGDQGRLGVATTLADVTTEREAVDALTASEQRFRLSFATAPVGMAVVALDGRLVEVNDALVDLLDRPREELLRLDFQTLTHPDDLDRDLELLGELLAGRRHTYVMEKRYLLPDGGVRWAALHVSTAVDADGVPRHLVGMAVDLTERKQLEDVLTHAANHDPLTGLPNRRLVEDRLVVALAERERRPGRVGVLYCDLDDFKAVNDAHGHGVGDAVLVELADRIHDCLRAGDTVGRLGGDEFVVVASGVADRADLAQLGARIAARVREPVDVGDARVRVGVSVGARLAGDDDDPSTLLRSADREMYRAKRTGGGMGAGLTDLPSPAEST